MNRALNWESIYTIFSNCVSSMEATFRRMLLLSTDSQLIAQIPLTYAQVADFTEPSVEAFKDGAARAAEQK